MTSLHEILEKLQKGEVTITEAEGYIRRKPFEDMGYAKLDTQRRFRSGFPEVVFAQGKANEHLVAICQKLYETEGELLVTRASEAQYRLIASVLPKAKYDARARIVTCGQGSRKPKGCVAVCTAGTADIAVAEEAAQVAEYFGCHVERIYDVGVSGLHRLLSQLPTIQSANCVIAVAGMEGALGSVVAGLVDKPVIAVPTSIGYGANLGGVSALLSMLNSCANGIATVNIDNGYGAGYLAAQINNLATAGE